jgi:hypothetical protein
LPKAKDQPTLATSGKIEQCFDWLSIGFLHCGDISAHFKIPSPLNQSLKSAHVFPGRDEKKQSRI